MVVTGRLLWRALWRNLEMLLSLNWLHQEPSLPLVTSEGRARKMELKVILCDMMNILYDEYFMSCENLINWSSTFGIRYYVGHKGKFGLSSVLMASSGILSIYDCQNIN